MKTIEAYKVRFSHKKKKKKKNGEILPPQKHFSCLWAELQYIQRLAKLELFQQDALYLSVTVFSPKTSREETISTTKRKRENLHMKKRN